MLKDDEQMVKLLSKEDTSRFIVFAAEANSKIEIGAFIFNKDTKIVAFEVSFQYSLLPSNS